MPSIRRTLDTVRRFLGYRTKTEMAAIAMEAHVVGHRIATGVKDLEVAVRASLQPLPEPIAIPLDDQG